MLRNHPTLKHVIGRAGWYFVTFLVAVTINFFLPRLGDANPIDTMMAKAGSGLDTRLRQREGRRLPQGVRPGRGRRARGNVVHDAAGKPIKAPLRSQFWQLRGHEPQGRPRHVDLAAPQEGHRDHQRPPSRGRSLCRLPTIILGWLLGNLLGALAAYKRGVFDRAALPAGASGERGPGVLLGHSPGLRLRASGWSGSPRWAATTTG